MSIKQCLELACSKADEASASASASANSATFAGEANSAAQIAADRAENVSNPTEDSYTQSEIDSMIEDAKLNTQTLYVDEVNGSDLNIGSSVSPLKTVKKAIELTKLGGTGYIIINGDVTIKSSSYINIKNKIIDIKNNTTAENAKVTLDIDAAQEYAIRVQEGAKLYIRTDSKTVNTYNTSMMHAIKVSDKDSVFMRNNNGKTINTGSTVRAACEISDDTTLVYQEGATLRLHDVDLTISATNAKLTKIAFTTATEIENSSVNGAEITTSGGEINSYINGVIKDGNGVPRNIISNIIL